MLQPEEAGYHGNLTFIFFFPEHIYAVEEEKRKHGRKIKQDTAQFAVNILHYYKNTVKRPCRPMDGNWSLAGEKKAVPPKMAQLYKNGESVLKKCRRQFSEHSVMLAKIQSVFLLNAKCNK